MKAVQGNLKLLLKILLLSLLILNIPGCGGGGGSGGSGSSGGGTAGGSLITVDFESLEPGSSVEGLGTVHRHLNISTTGGNTRVIVEGALNNSYGSYGAPNDPNMNMLVGCLGAPGSGVPVSGRGKGFADYDRRHDYVFTFSPKETVRDFSVTMLDFGDFNPTMYASHEVSLTAYDAENKVVDKDTLSYKSSREPNPRSSDFGDLWYAGDACTAKTDFPNQEPGIWTFKVTGSKIVRVEFDLVTGGDTAIGFDNIQFRLD
jgi:hypothetical protein